MDLELNKILLISILVVVSINLLAYVFTSKSNTGRIGFSVPKLNLEKKE